MNLFGAQNMYNQNTKEREITPFQRSLYKIPAIVIVCNVAGPIKEEYFADLS
jgi:hypothetical protein